MWIRDCDGENYYGNARRQSVRHARLPYAYRTCPARGRPYFASLLLTVLTGSLPQARVTDMAVCVGPPDVIVLGSFTVLVGDLPAARMGDMTAHGGTIVLGLPTVLIG